MMMIQRLLLLLMTMILAPVTSSTLHCSTPDHGTVLSPACVSSDQLRSSENIVTLTNTTRDPGHCAQVNDHLVGYGTSHSASSSKYHHLALLVALVFKFSSLALACLACGASVTLGWLSSPLIATSYYMIIVWGVQQRVAGHCDGGGGDQQWGGAVRVSGGEPGHWPGVCWHQLQHWVRGSSVRRISSSNCLLQLLLSQSTG